MFDIIENDIRQSLRPVSPLDPAPDPKMEPTGSFLYVPRCEDIEVIRGRVRARGAGDTVEVRYLPDDWSVIDRHGLLYLPNDYVAPGSRFREMYFWDTNWIIKGLLRDGHVDLARGMVENCFYAIDNYGGKVPNANRTYYLSRSQPPFLGPMVMQIARHLGGAEQRDFLVRAEAALAKEYSGFWRAHRYTGETGLFRYGHPGDGKLGLCPEVVFGERDPVTGRSHYEKLADKLRALPENNPLRDRFLDPATHSLTQAAIIGDRAMRESGFDPSMHLGYYGLETHDYNPVCLNTLMENQCSIVSGINAMLGRRAAADKWQQEAANLRDRIQGLLWDEKQGLFMAYNNVTKERSAFPFLTAIYPLWTGIATPEQAQRFRDNLHLFETPHGMATSPHVTECQWDGRIWPFFADIGVEAMETNGFSGDALRVGKNFIGTVDRVSAKEGVICEKYNPDGTSHVKVGMGYEENVTGFGPTAGAYRAVRERVMATADVGHHEPIRKDERIRGGRFLQPAFA